MTIPTQMSLHGFIATAPQINFTSKGRPVLRPRRHRALPQGDRRQSFTKLDPTFHDLVLYAETAERAYARFKVGDQFVASGYINEYEHDRNGQTETREQFVARQHRARLRPHPLRRRPRPRRASPTRRPTDLTVVKEPAQVVGL